MKFKLRRSSEMRSSLPSMQAFPTQALTVNLYKVTDPALDAAPSPTTSLRVLRLETLPPAPIEASPSHPPARSDKAELRLAIRPGDWSDPDDPMIRELLEQLDDAFFEALNGCAASLARAQELWPRIAGAVDSEMLNESREQYLRRAVDVTRQFEIGSRRTSAQALAALEVISLLTNEHG